MLSIQQVGQEILNGTPQKFYIFAGSEYGVKDRYISILEQHYGDKIEASSISEILSMMRVRRIVPLTPALYVVRYDEAFVSSLSESTKRTIANTNIRGTVVGIYEQPKQVSRLEKYLSDYTVSIEPVSPTFVHKYLVSEFPKLSENLVDVAVSASANYSHARNICRCLSSIPSDEFSKMSNASVAKLFGYSDTSSEKLLKIGVASRNFSFLHDALIVQEYSDLDTVLYTFLQTMIEIDKLLDNSRISSDLKPYAKLWSREDVYHMFNHVYRELQRMRSLPYYDIRSSLVYLISLLQFQPIPSVEVMK